MQIRGEYKRWLSEKGKETRSLFESSDGTYGSPRIFALKIPVSAVRLRPWPPSSFQFHQALTRVRFLNSFLPQSDQGIDNSSPPGGDEASRERYRRQDRCHHQVDFRITHSNAIHEALHRATQGEPAGQSDH